ncbi:MAG: hypothetical protein MZV70_41505 [Desulfobacterales bacterium]|nr:hypothetical protein [Desulfobacterales bacterium]
MQGLGLPDEGALPRLDARATKAFVSDVSRLCGGDGCRRGPLRLHEGKCQ